MAETVSIPVIEGETATAPFPRVDDNCGWCGVRLGAVHDVPQTYRGRWFHPTGCWQAAAKCR